MNRTLSLNNYNKNNSFMGSGSSFHLTQPELFILSIASIVLFTLLFNMACDGYCNCAACLDLKNCDQIIRKQINEDVVKSETKYTFFGVESSDWFSKNEDEEKKIEAPVENKHKSVIYVNDEPQLDVDNIEENSRITITEQIDEYMALDSIENSHIINVIFKNTFSFASQIIDDIRTCNEYYSDSYDDFPLGMEADLLKQYLEQKR